MTYDEALDWIQQVDGVLYENPHRAERNDAWVAVVRRPSGLPRPGRVIVTSGRTLPLAIAAAEREWNAIWAELGPHH